MATSLTWKDVSGISAADSAKALEVAGSAWKNATQNFTDGFKAIDDQANQEVNHEVLNRMLAYQGQGADAYNRAVASGALTQGLDTSRINTNTFENVRGYGGVLDDATQKRITTQEQQDVDAVFRTNQAPINAALAAAHSGDPRATAQGIQTLSGLPGMTPKVLNSLLTSASSGYQTAMTNANNTFNFDKKVLERNRTERVLGLTPVFNSARTSVDAQNIVDRLIADNEDPAVVQSAIKQFQVQGFKLNVGKDPVQETLLELDNQQTLANTPLGGTAPATKTQPSQGNFDNLEGIAWAESVGLRSKESSNDPTALFEDKKGRSYGGLDQIGDARLKDAFRAGVISRPMTGKEYSNLPREEQNRVADWHYKDLDKQIQQQGLTKYIGQTVGGVPVTLSSLRAMSHLGGIGGTAAFLNSGGKEDPADLNKTRISDYGKKFAGSGTPAAPSNTDLVDGFRPNAPAGPGVTTSPVTPASNIIGSTLAAGTGDPTAPVVVGGPGSAPQTQLQEGPTSVTTFSKPKTFRENFQDNLDKFGSTVAKFLPGTQMLSRSGELYTGATSKGRDTGILPVGQSSVPTQNNTTSPAGSAQNPLSADKLMQLDNASMRKVIDAAETLAMDDQTRLSLLAARANQENLYTKLTPATVGSQKSIDEIYENTPWKQRANLRWFRDSVQEIKSMAKGQALSNETAAVILELSQDSGGILKPGSWFNDSRLPEGTKDALSSSKRVLNTVTARALVSMVTDTGAMAAGNTKAQQAQKAADNSAALVKDFERYTALLGQISSVNNPNALNQRQQLMRHLMTLVEKMPAQMRDEYRRQLPDTQ